MAGIALLLVSIPLYADTADTNAAAASPAPGAGGDFQQVAQMPPGPDQTKALVAALKAWAQPDPKATADWLVQQPNPGVNMMCHGYFLTWTAKDAAAAKAWCLQNQGIRDNRYVAIFSVADGLCRRKGADAAAWALTLPPGDDRNAAIDGTVTIWCRGGLPDMTAWIKQMNPTDMKWAAILGAKNWKAAGGPLPAWVDQLPLSAGDKAEVMKVVDAKGPYPDSFHISKYQPAPAAAAAKP